jgi:hypothetical protein
MRMQIGRNKIRRLIIPALIGLLALPSLAASTKWQSVQKIKPNTFVYVGLAEEKHLEGRFLFADAESMTIRTVAQHEIILPRDRIQWITIDHKGRPWYSIPLAVISGAAGGAAGYTIANHTSCSDTHDVCSKARGATIILSAGAAGGLAYSLSRRPSNLSKKIVYKNP